MCSGCEKSFCITMILCITRSVIVVSYHPLATFPIWVPCHEGVGPYQLDNRAQIQCLWMLCYVMSTWPMSICGNSNAFGNVFPTAHRPTASLYLHGFLI